MGNKLYRSTKNKMISGVCGGIGELTGIDPTIIRVVWAIGSLCCFVIGGIIIYIVVAMIVPQDPGYTDT